MQFSIWIINKWKYYVNIWLADFGKCRNSWRPRWITCLSGFGEEFAFSERFLKVNLSICAGVKYFPCKQCRWEFVVAATCSLLNFTPFLINLKSSIGQVIPNAFRQLLSDADFLTVDTTNRKSSQYSAVVHDPDKVKHTALSGIGLMENS